MGLRPSPQDPIFLQCFDTVGYGVIWVPDMTYNVLVETLNLTEPKPMEFDTYFTKQHGLVNWTTV